MSLVFTTQMKACQLSQIRINKLKLDLILENCKFRHHKTDKLLFHLLGKISQPTKGLKIKNSNCFYLTQNFKTGKSLLMSLFLCLAHNRTNL